MSAALMAEPECGGDATRGTPTTTCQIMMLGSPKGLTSCTLLSYRWMHNAFQWCFWPCPWQDRAAHAGGVGESVDFDVQSLHGVCRCWGVINVAIGLESGPQTTYGRDSHPESSGDLCRTVPSSEWAYGLFSLCGAQSWHPCFAKTAAFPGRMSPGFYS